MKPVSSRICRADRCRWSRRASQAAYQFNQMARRFEEQRNLIQLVTDSQPTSIFILDKDDKYRFANRQAAKDRLAATHDYEVNLKAELEIAGLHEKLDKVRTEQLAELIRFQQEQIRMLTALVAQRKTD